MNLTVGNKLKSAVCGMEAIVIRPPAAPGRLACGGAAMAVGAEPAPALAALAQAQPGCGLIGKRYVDEVSGLELLCTKGGKGALSFDGRALELKAAKPLPSSD
ncbi:MAG: hypothetical protein JWP96_2203 [Polaromonas sp.]|nr:hypothetical protein [Polaromonas sp.]